VPGALEKAFNYSLLDEKTAGSVQCSVARIKESLKRSLDGIIEAGMELCLVKAALPHGAFGAWLRAEFDWHERTARNLMNVAERFGTKTEIISDLRIDPTAAYLLATRSVPEKAVEIAVERAQAGEHVTAADAREILAQIRPNSAHREPVATPEKLAANVVKAIEPFRDRLNANQRVELAKLLRKFADSLTKRGKREGK
jgi:hypothetical protein